MGPTACGKSVIAVQVAKALGDVEIVSADSMQVYRGMDVGTAKPTLAERGGVPHHLLDVVGPEQDWDVAQFVSHAVRTIEAIASRGNRAMLVGGTGLYVHALVDRFEVPGRWPEVASTLEALGTDELYVRLRDLDPTAAAKIDPGNRRRTLRALEVTIGGGRPFSSYGPGVGAFPRTDWRLAGIWLPRQVLARRIGERFETMVDQGLVGEVRRLLEGPALSRTARQALGYREVLSHLENGLAWEEVVSLAVTRTRQFARRQRMWWRRDPRVRWYGSPASPSDIVPALLGDWGHV